MIVIAILGGDRFLDRDVCPVECCTYTQIRGNVAFTANPTATSVMGLLRAKSGIAFDLPRHAQWEIACRAGCASYINVPGATMDQVAWTTSNRSSDPKVVAGLYGNGATTHEVGLLLPNAFGLYDTIGNVLEMGRDYLQVAFGCYGGHHRSVYLAERFAERLSGTDGIEIAVTHTARQYWSA